MGSRLNERYNRTNQISFGHDNIGNYMLFNSVRFYSVTTAITDATSTTVSGHTAPRGSILNTSHATGRDFQWVAGQSGTWERVGQEVADVGGIAATGYYDFTLTGITTAPASGTARLFNGTSFTWQTTVSNALVQAQRVSTLVDANGVRLAAYGPNDTLLGVNIFNMLAVLNASVVAGVAQATYTDNSTLGAKNATRIIPTNDAEGVVGNLYTLGTADDANGVRSAATLTGGVDALAGVKEYSGNLIQTSTNAPTITMRRNDFGGDAAPVWARTSAGLYTLTKVGMFTANKTIGRGGVVNATAAGAFTFFSLERTSADVMTLRVSELTSGSATIAAKEISAITAVNAIIPIDIYIGN